MSKSKIKMKCMQGVWYVETTYYNVHCVAIADSVSAALNYLKCDMNYIERGLVLRSVRWK